MWHFCNTLRHQPDRGWRLVCHCALFFFVTMVVRDPLVFAQSNSEERLPRAAAASKSDGKTRKSVNKIPYDVFFDDPLQVVSTQARPVASSVATPAPAVVPPSKTIESNPASQVATNSWSKRILIEDLLGEIKTIRNELTKSLSTPGQYNQNFKSIAVHGGCIAALAVIGQQHEEDLSWKSNSRYVRDFGAQINLAASGLGREHFDKSRSAFQRLTSVLDGSVPADAGDVADVRPFQEVASRKSLMKRIERAKDWLKQDVNSEAKFKSLSDPIRHEAAILAAFATVIATPGYEYTENDDYQNYAKSLIDGAIEASSSTSTESYDDFKRAVDKVNKSCTDCHSSYGNG